MSTRMLLGLAAVLFSGAALAAVTPCPDLISEADQVFGAGYGNTTQSWTIWAFKDLICTDDYGELSTNCANVYEYNLGQLQLESNLSAFQPVEHVLAAGLSIGTSYQGRLIPAYSLTQTYHIVKNASDQELLDDHDDADGDGVDNRSERNNVAFRGGDVQRFIAAFTNPDLNGTECPGAPVTPCPDIVGGIEAYSGLFTEYERAMGPVLQEVICSTSYFMSTLAACTYINNLAVAYEVDSGFFDTLPPELVPVFIAGLSASSDEQQAVVVGHGLTGTYTVIKDGDNELFGREGDLDGDGVSNQQEYDNVEIMGGGLDLFKTVVLDADLDGAECVGGELDDTLPDTLPQMIDEQGAEFYQHSGFGDWSTDDMNHDGWTEQAQSALFADVLNNPNAPYHDEAVCVFLWNQGVFRQDQQDPPCGGIFASYEDVFAAVLSMSTEIQIWVLEEMHNCGYVPDPNRYRTVKSQAKLPNDPFAADGDLDGDGVPNVVEYQNSIDAGLGLEDFVVAAQQPLLDGSQPASSLPLGPAVLPSCGLGLMAAAYTVFRRRRSA